MCPSLMNSHTPMGGNQLVLKSAIRHQGPRSTRPHCAARQRSGQRYFPDVLWYYVGAIQH